MAKLVHQMEEAFSVRKSVQLGLRKGGVSMKKVGSMLARAGTCTQSTLISSLGIMRCITQNAKRCNGTGIKQSKSCLSQQPGCCSSNGKPLLCSESCSPSAAMEWAIWSACVKIVRIYGLSCQRSRLFVLAGHPISPVRLGNSWEHGCKSHLIDRLDILS